MESEEGSGYVAEWAVIPSDRYDCGLTSCVRLWEGEKGLISILCVKNAFALLRRWEVKAQDVTGHTLLLQPWEVRTISEY